MNSNLEIAKGMIAEGHAKEAAQWVKMVAPILREHEFKALACLLADAILQPVKRKRGDKSGKGDKFADLAKELAIVRAVHEFNGTLTDAYLNVGKRFHKSEKTVAGYCQKWKANAT